MSATVLPSVVVGIHSHAGSAYFAPLLCITSFSGVAPMDLFGAISDYHQARLFNSETEFGKRCNRTHTLCHRCGVKAYHLQKLTCSKCGYPAKCRRTCNWSAKAKRQNATRTGRTRHLKIVHHRFRHGFHEETTPKPKRAAVGAPQSA
ncbi:large ribosomal subunit protein eL37-like [Pongo abelii]|uniref:large ribosomal subunit protein eL37-like n=1 Tax=Pongo abelii TaxID=9601 RepID=UPI0023E7678A|nr:60S ribosomal protein L37-like [Pongo abelii]